MAKTILIIEDQAEIAQFIQRLLEREGFTCYLSSDGLDGVRAAQELQPDLIILDLMLPGMDGLEVCTHVRRQRTNKDPYILMVTARGDEIDRIIGLSTGADDYMVKPFSPLELVARVRALLRRSLRHAETAPTYRTPHFTVNLEKHVAERHCDDQGELLDLTTIEFNLLTVFVSQPGRAWSRTQLIDRLWGKDFFGDERIVDTHVARLRKKIEPDPTHPIFIKTVVGTGYKFEDQTDFSNPS